MPSLDKIAFQFELVISLLLWFTPAHAANDLVPAVQIHIKPGDQCWAYRGYGTRFYGDFAGDQSLTISVVEQDKDEHGGITTTAYNGEGVWVTGPEFYLDGHREPNPSDPFIHTAKPGRYQFDLMEHGTGLDLPVFFQICALSKISAPQASVPQPSDDDKTQQETQDIGPSTADTYTYVCRVGHKAYPVTVDEDKGTLTWRGTTFRDLKSVPDCKYAWQATNNGVTAELCTATQGVADLTIDRERFDCQMKR